MSPDPALVGLVVVSHSRALAAAAVALAREMEPGGPRIEIAAGLDETTFGTDATAIAAAVPAADAGAGVVVLMDLGSAVLSAELALELLDPDLAARVSLSPAPLVEGLVAAVVTAAGGADRDTVAAEAAGALRAKATQLGGAVAAGGSPAAPPDHPAEADAEVVSGGFVVVDPHGLHARPAARIVAAAQGLDATVRLRNTTTGSAWAPGASLSRVTELAALTGHEIEIAATGPDAGAAVAAVSAAAVAAGLAAALPPAGHASPAPLGPVETAIAVDQNVPDGVATPPGLPAAAGEATGTGAARPARPGARALGASPGIAVGPARLLRAAAPVVPDARADDPGAEWAALAAARAAVAEAVTRTRELTARTAGAEESAIFDAHLMMLDDPELLDDVRSRLDHGQAAAPAWAGAVDAVARRLAALPGEYLRARAADVRAVGDQVLRALLGEPAGPDPAAADGVLVAADLTPADAAALDPASVVGVVLATGSPTAHAAILLRAKGIPAIVGAGPAVLGIAAATMLAIDGSTGELLVDPSDEMRARFHDRAAARVARERIARSRAGHAARTRDGTRVMVGVNAGSAADAAAAPGADVAGLVRTEFLFLGRRRAPGVDEQEAAYLAVAEALGGRRITLRTLDVGGDKPLDYVPMPVEANPFLGVRGLRLALRRPELLTDQLRAIVRTAHATPVSLMFPMVSTVDELLSARALLADAIAAEGRGTPVGLQVGIMVEVPATALKAAAFAPHVDFLSIGTNDLTQYALAAERGNDAVAAVADPLDPGVLALIDAVCRGAGPNLLVAVCGELAADERAVPLLVGLGVRELSVAAPALAGVKEAVRAVDLAEATALAARAVRAGSAAEVRDLLGSGSGADPARLRPAG